MVITNGNITWVYKYNNVDNIYDEIEDIPNFHESQDESWSSTCMDEYKLMERPTAEELYNKDWVEKRVHEKYLDWIIGLDTPDKYWTIVIDFYHLLMSDEVFFNEPINWLGYKFIKDLGVSLHTFGNASGGKYFGRYRSFLFSDRARNDQIVRFIIIANMKTLNDPRYGTGRGKSMFNVAVCHGENMHNSLQLSLDDFLVDTGKEYKIHHNGTMAVANLGRRKNKEVLDFVKDKEPKLLVNDKVILGTIPKQHNISWVDIRELLLNTAGTMSLFQFEINRLRFIYIFDLCLEGVSTLIDVLIFRKTIMVCTRNHSHTTVFFNASVQSEPYGNMPSYLSKRPCQ